MGEIKNNRFLQSLILPLKFLLLLWGIHLFQFLFHFELGWLGIRPGTLHGALGILFAPLIHSGWGHLISNTPPLFYLGVLVLLFYRKVAIPSFLMIYFLTGLGVWLLARPVYHIGASGVVFGLFAFVLGNGIFRRNIKSIVLSLIVLFYYGSMFTGILPGQDGISWESHLSGLLVGLFTASWYKKDIEKDEKKPQYSWEKEPDHRKSYFLDRDVFDKTKEERKWEKEQNSNDPFSGWFSSRT